MLLEPIKFWQVASQYYKKSVINLWLLQNILSLLGCQGTRKLFKDPRNFLRQEIGTASSLLVLFKRMPFQTLRYHFHPTVIFFQEIRNFSVFLDVDRLEAGKFDNNLLQSIRSARNFILVLTPGQQKTTIFLTLLSAPGPGWVAQFNRAPDTTDQKDKVFFQRFCLLKF